MLKRILTLVGENKEILTSLVVDVVDTMNVKLNTGMDEVALEKLFKETPPGTEIPLSKLPYITTNYLAIVTGNGSLLYFPTDSIIIDYDIKQYDNEEWLASTDEDGDFVVHSKYVFDEKGNSGKGVLKANKLFVEPFIIVPDLKDK